MRRLVLAGVLLGLTALLPAPVAAQDEESPKAAALRSSNLAKRRKELGDELAKAKTEQARTLVARDEASVRANTFQLPADKLAVERAIARLEELAGKITELEAKLAELPPE